MTFILSIFSRLRCCTADTGISTTSSSASFSSQAVLSRSSVPLPKKLFGTIADILTVSQKTTSCPIANTSPAASFSRAASSSAVIIPAAVLITGQITAVLVFLSFSISNKPASSVKFPFCRPDTVYRPFLSPLTAKRRLRPQRPVRRSSASICRPPAFGRKKLPFKSLPFKSRLSAAAKG